MDVESVLREALAGRYAVERQLGSGAMALVFLADDLRYDRRVAIKVFRPDLASTLGGTRFLREIRLTAQLQHPHIVPLFDSGEIHGLLYFVMPHVEGETLRDRIARERQLNVDDALEITRQVARALDYAHARGVVHRDVKPANILLSGGVAMIADFGIAHALASTADDEQTATGIAVGTPRYMSPEQSDGLASALSDQYSLACVTYEMLVGVPPFQGRRPAAVMRRHSLEMAPSIRAVRPLVAAGVEAAVMPGMAKIPADRFATVTQYADAAIAASGSRGVNAWSVRRRTVAAVAVATVAASLVLVSKLRPTTNEVHRVAVIHEAVAPGQELFADGLTAEVNSRVAAIEALHVIARSSARAYDNYAPDAAPTARVARDLGVDYVLTLDISPRSGSGDAQSVDVSAELTQVANRTVAWSASQRVRINPDSLFEVQRQIAESVAGALRLKLGDAARAAVASRPTKSLDAYERFLRGNLLSFRGRDDIALDSAIHEYEAAVALDPKFGLAFARLSQMQSVYYFDLQRTDSLMKQRAWANAKRAEALDPRSSATELALGYYYHWTEAKRDSASVHLDLAAAAEPNNPELWSIRGSAFRFRGQWQESVDAARRAAALDPMSSHYAFELGGAYLWARRYAEADSVLRRAEALDPTYFAPVVMRSFLQLLWRGDVEATRSIIDASVRPPSTIDTAHVLMTIIPRYRSFMSVLGDGWQLALERSSLNTLKVPPGPYYLAKAEMYERRQERDTGATAGRSAALARAYFDSARVLLEQRAHGASGAASDPFDHEDLGEAYVGVGRGADGVREAQEGFTVGAARTDSTTQAYLAVLAIRTYAKAGQTSRAIDLVEQQLAGNTLISRAELLQLPYFKPLWNEPRYRALALSSRR